MRQLFETGMTADGHALQNRIRPDTPQLQPDRHCDSCAVCKHHAAKTPHSVPEESSAKRPLETVHIDLQGRRTRLLRAVRDSSPTTSTARRNTPSSVRSHNGGEFVGKEWTPLLTRLGILRQLTSPYTTQQGRQCEQGDSSRGGTDQPSTHQSRWSLKRRCFHPCLTTSRHRPDRRPE